MERVELKFEKMHSVYNPIRALLFGIRFSGGEYG